MTQLESLNKDFQIISNWENHFRYTLLKYIYESLEYLKGEAEVPVKYKTEDEADDAGESFFCQFPSFLQVEDEEGMSVSLFVNKLYKKGDRFVVDGFNFSEGKWMTGCLTDDETETYERLAGFLNAVMNPVKE